MNLWHRIWKRAPTVGPNRRDRRALRRLSRVPGYRRELTTIAARLRPLTPEQRERVYAGMDPDRVIELRWALRH